MYINVDVEELNKMLSFLSSGRVGNWKRYAPSSRDIDILFKNHYADEFLEYFYDSEPDYDEETHNMYLDYCTIRGKNELVTGVDFYEICLKSDKDRYSEKDHILKELKSAYHTIVKQRDAYNKKRIRFNNWVELHECGNWDSTQEEVDSLGKITLTDMKKSPLHKHDRFWIFKDKDNWDILIYYYGRDYIQCDYAWVMKKRKKLW